MSPPGRRRPRQNSGVKIPPPPAPRAPAARAPRPRFPGKIPPRRPPPGRPGRPPDFVSKLHRKSHFLVGPRGPPILAPRPEISPPGPEYLAPWEREPIFREKLPPDFGPPAGAPKIGPGARAPAAPPGRPGRARRPARPPPPCSPRFFRESLV